MKRTCALLAALDIATGRDADALIAFLDDVGRSERLPH